MHEYGDVIDMPSLFGDGGTRNPDQDFWKDTNRISSIVKDISEWPKTLLMRPETRERDFAVLVAQVMRHNKPGKRTIYAAGRPAETKIAVVIPHLTKSMHDDYSLTTSGDARKTVDSLVSYGLRESQIMVLAAIPFFPDNDWGKAQPGRGVSIPEYVRRVFVPYLRCALEILRPHTVLIMNGQSMEIMNAIYKVAGMPVQRLALTVKSEPEEDERMGAAPRLGMLDASAQFRVAPRLTMRLVRIASPYYITTESFASSDATRNLGGLDEALQRQDALIRDTAKFTPTPPPSTNAFDRLMGRARPTDGQPSAKRARSWATAFGGRLTTLAQPSEEAVLVTLSARDGFLVWIDASTHPIVNSKGRKGVTYTHLRPLGRPDDRWSPASLSTVVSSVVSSWAASKNVAILCNDGVRVSAILSAAIMLRVVPFLSSEQAIDLSKKEAWKAWAGEAEVSILSNLRLTHGAAWLTEFRREEGASKLGMRRLLGMVVDEECSEVRHFEFGHHPEPLASAFLDAITPRLAPGRYVYSMDQNGHRRFAAGVTDPAPGGENVVLDDIPAPVLCEFIFFNK